MTIPPILKNKWVLLGGAAVVIVAVVASGAKSATSTQVSAAGPTDAQVSAERDITIAQLNAQVQQNAQNGQIALVQAQGQVDLAKAGLDAQLSQYAIDAQTATANLQYTSSRDIQLASLAHDDAINSAQINSQNMIAKWTLDQATANATIQSNFQLDYAEAANSTQISLAQMQAQLVNNQLTVGRDVQLAGIASQETLAAINANLQQNVTYSNNSTQQAIYATMSNATVEQARISAVNTTEQARIAAGAQKHSSTMSAIGSVLGGVLSIFSDRRLKSDVEKIGEYSDGLGIYQYYVPWAEAKQHGVMADEVALIRPWALGPVIEGFQTVNYTGL